MSEERYFFFIAMKLEQIEIFMSYHVPQKQNFFNFAIS